MPAKKSAPVNTNPLPPEPDWSEYRIDYVFDSPGVQNEKVHDFMHAWIDWREKVQAVTLPTKKPAAQDT